MAAGGGRVGRTYGFVSAKFDEGVKKRTNSGKAGRNSGFLWTSSDENFDLSFEGLEDGEHHFLKVWIQEIRLLLEAVYLYEKKCKCYQG